MSQSSTLRRRISKEQAEGQRVFKQLEKAYKALHNLTMFHYNICDEEEDKFLDYVEDELLRLLRRYQPTYGRPQDGLGSIAKG